MNTKKNEMITVASKNSMGVNDSVLGWMNVSKFSAKTIEEFEIGKTYTVEIEDYVHNGIKRKRILRCLD